MASSPDELGADRAMTNCQELVAGFTWLWQLPDVKRWSMVDGHGIAYCVIDGSL